MKFLLVTLAGLSLGFQEAASKPAASPEIRESWESLYMNGKRVGYAHSVVDRVESNGQAVFRSSAKQVLVMKRFDDTIRMELEFITYETSDGWMYAFDSKLKQPGEDQISKGRWADGKMKVSLKTAGNEQQQTVAWTDDMVGLAKLDRLLRDKPLKEGETRTAKTFFPGLNQTIEVKYVGLGPKKVKMMDGSERELFGIKMEQTVPGEKGGGTKLPATEYFVDEHGEPLRSEIPLGGVNVVSYKTTAKEALAELGDEPGIDFGFSTLIKCESADASLRTARRVVYKLELGDEEATKGIADGGYQKIVKKEGTTLWVAVERKAPPKDVKPGPAGEEFLAANGFIQSEDPEIKNVATSVTSSITEPWAKCQALEKWVRANMARSDFTVGFATASDTIRSKRGDCTEHGVLLAALCRAIGVPARTAMGLVYVDSLKSFGYHMWTEVNFGGEWYALDGTIGEGIVGGDHIKVADGSLKGASAMGALLPVFQVMGKLKIAVDRKE